MATPVVLTTGARPITPVESGGVPMTPVDTLGEPVTVVDTLGEPVVLVNNDGTPAFLAYSAKTYLGGVAPYHWLDFINNRALYASVDVGNVTQATGYSFTRASTGYYQNADGTLTSFASGALRRGDRGVLIEGSRTNLLLRSQTFDNAYWIKTRVSVTANATTAPDGTNTAAKLVEDSSTNTHKLESTTFSTGLTSGINYAYSVFLKASERTWAVLEVTGALGGGYAWFNLANGTVGTTVNLVSASVQALANGWYRCTIVDLSTGTGDGATSCNIFPATADNVVNYTGNGTSGIFIWQADLQAGAFPSSPIVTVAASATRAADVLTYTAGVSYPATLWAEWQRIDGTDATSFYRVLSVNTIANETALYHRHTNDVVRAYQNNASVIQADLTLGTANIGGIHKAAGSFGANNVRGSLSGAAVTSDLSVTMPSDPALMAIGANTGGSNNLFGHIRRIAVFNSALTDAQLQTTTS